MENKKILIGFAASIIVLFAIFKIFGAQNTPTSTDNPSMEESNSNSIENITWRWTEFQDTAGKNDITVDDPDKYTFKLMDDSMYFMQADCNSVRGQYTLDGSSLTFGPGATTLMYCGDGSLDSVFIQNMSNVVTYVFDGDKLVLNLKLDSGNMVFTK